MYLSDDLEIEAIKRVLDSRKLFRYQGKDCETECSQFEKRFADYLDSKKTILVSSGTNALVNALFTVGVKEGDEVIIPAYTFFATAAAVMELKAIPVVVNIDESLSFDFEELKSKISSRTKAIIVVHMDGYPSDMARVSKVANEFRLALIEDCAQAAGGKYQNKKLGSFGDAGCFSFNMDKIITCGEGGAISFNDEALYQKAFLYHDTCNQFGPTCKDMYTIDRFSGKSMRASEIQGAMINVQLGRLDEIIFNLRSRKTIMEDKLRSAGFSFVPSFDTGDIATTIRIKCNDAVHAHETIKSLQSQNLRAWSANMKPAHNAWQWSGLLPVESEQPKFNFMTTMEILSRTVLVQVDYQ